MAAIPLTTTFTPPTACLSDLWVVSTSVGGAWMNLGPGNTTECLPSGWSPTTYFSPGICPSGYVIATSTTASVNDAVETIATCCPVDSDNTYSVRPASTASTLQAWQSLMHMSEICQWSPGANVQTAFNYTYSSSGSVVTATTSLDSSGLINAYGVEIRWQSSDFASSTAVTTTATATTTATTAQSPSQASATSTSTSSSTSTSKSSSGLSNGAKIGVGVGVAIGGVLVISLVVAWFLYRKRQKGRNASSELPTVSDKGTAKNEGVPVELGGVSYHEMES
ncbi:hypothetical protein ASPZODRAFT_136018 [Penicilliopsis zonata CBS 506.65]|uniref:Mid2 domain-containing protein n=1 Tax=Penicilliopsis zonata CBS 506.65 TaxID=1073090 RepID=A0A1L9S8S7_9EURO|nr:hypothetical protein ASPZODRAFT_136018 [Penicilliopsis zonata CBS 506.65]OJJ43563.1 hypothetical protein ASPZODRAFT_136018 [Penicilliopsis zonata CBS 506.65]